MLAHRHRDLAVVAWRQVGCARNPGSSMRAFGQACRIVRMKAPDEFPAKAPDELSAKPPDMFFGFRGTPDMFRETV
jgi:hypothetical protein